MASTKEQVLNRIKKAISQKKKLMQSQANNPNQPQKPDMGLNISNLTINDNNGQNPEVLASAPATDAAKLKIQQEHLALSKAGDKIEQEKDLGPVLEVFSYRQQVLLKNPFVAQVQKTQETEEDIERQIQIMTSQKQSRRYEDQEQKKKQILLNTLKNKKKPRPPKPMDKPTPFNQLSPPYQQIKIFASYLKIYEQRRRRQLYSTIVDLGVKTLQQVIMQCLLQGFISKSFMKQIKKTGAEMQIDFVKKFASNQLDKYDFQSTKFTPLDHRGLCGLLLKHDKKYILGQRIYCVFKELTDFYEVIYGMEEYEYQRLCQAIRIKYKLFWRESALKSIPIMDQQQLNKFDTSTIFKLRPSPLFGADLQNDDKQFFKAKRQKYPDKTKPPVKKQQKAHPKAPQDQDQANSSQDLSQSYQSSQDESNIEKDIQAQAQSQMLPSSMYKSSSLKSSVKKSRKGKEMSSRSESQSQFRSSSNMSEQGQEQESEEFDDNDDEDDQRIGSETDSMYKSRSKSMSKRPVKKQVKKAKNQMINKNDSQSNISKQSSSFIDSQQMQNANIFEDYQDMSSSEPNKKKKNK